VQLADMILHWCGFFPGFGNMITSDTFQDADTCFSQIEALISVVSFTNSFI
jgi:hypothetical protein